MSIAFDPVASKFIIRLDPRLLDPTEAWRRRCRQMGISENAIWVCEWTERMALEHGGTVRGHGKAWDWGQALCVERYGAASAVWPDDVTDDDVARARAWEQGRWPKWVRSPKAGKAK